MTAQCPPVEPGKPSPVTAVLARYQALCLVPAPLNVLSAEEGGTADWWDLGHWVETQVSQEDLFQLYSEMSRLLPLACEPERTRLFRASEVVCIAMSDATIERLARLS